MGINHVTLSGNITRDCERRESSTGVFIIKFTVAVNERVNNGGAWEDRPSFFDCTIFAKSQKRADYLSGVLVKGAYLIVDGKLRQSTWEKDGQKKSRIEVIAESVETPKSKKAEAAYEMPDDDIPF